MSTTVQDVPNTKNQKEYKPNGPIPTLYVYVTQQTNITPFRYCYALTTDNSMDHNSVRI